VKCKIIIDKTRAEEVIEYVHRPSIITEEIERVCSEEKFELIGYGATSAVKISLLDVCCFTVEDNKIWAITNKDKLQIKCRLYQLEDQLPDGFMKINQSCLANMKMIERFDTSITGSLLVRFKNGYSDYVSRRNIKKVKERFGL